MRGIYVNVIAMPTLIVANLGKASKQFYGRQEHAQDACI